MPLFSILIVTKNRSRLLSSCLASLVGTKVHNWEIIVVDNASTDDTKNTTASFKPLLPIRYFSTDAVGFPAVYNFGITKCRGRTIVFLDDDCVVSKNWPISITHVITSFPDEIIQGKIISEPKGNIYAEIMGDHYQNWTQSHMISKTHLNCFDNKNLCVPRGLFEKFGCFDESLVGGSEDIELSRRMCAQGARIRYEDTITAHHRERTTFFGFISQHARIAKSEGYLDANSRGGKKTGLTNSSRVYLYIKSIIVREILYVKSMRIIHALQLPALYILLVLIRIWGYGIGRINIKTVYIK